MPERDIVCFDIETTGLSAQNDHIIEIGMVRFRADGTFVEARGLLVNPGVHIPWYVTRLTGISDRLVAGVTRTELDAVTELAEFARDADILGHNVGFDRKFCEARLPGMFDGKVEYDTLPLVRILLPDRATQRLEELTRDLAVAHRRPHRAKSDALATRLLFLRLRQMARSLPPERLAEVQANPKAPEGVRRFFAGVAAAQLRARRRPATARTRAAVRLAKVPPTARQVGATDLGGRRSATSRAPGGPRPDSTHLG